MGVLLATLPPPFFDAPKGIGFLIMSRLLGFFCATFLAISMIAAPASAETLDPENTLYLELKDGRVVIQLRPDLAPKHVERIKKLTREGFYDGLKFHRVIRGFMAQTGDPLGNGTGGSKYPDLSAEFSSEPHIRGTLSMARSGHPDSANSQFFIMFGRAPHLDNQYSIWGQVVSGMEFVDKIKKGIGSRNGEVRNPDIISMKVAADADKK